MVKGLKAPKMRWVEVVCPECGEIYWRKVEVEYLDTPHAWYRSGYPVIMCEDCRKDYRRS